MDRIAKIIEEIEFEFVELSRQREFPLKDKEQIKALIWNLLTSEKWRSRISYKDYSKILDVWIIRLN